jgi:hypothetical protein
MATFIAGQLTSLRASPLGHWLGPAPAAAPGLQISLGEVVRKRGVALFSLDRAAHGRPADTIADLVAQDATEVYTGLHRAAIGGDGLAWFGQCETVDPQALAGLVSAGADAGLATVLSTASAAAVGRLADQVSVLVLHRLDDHALAGQLARLTGRRLVPADRHSTDTVQAVTGWAEPAGAPADAEGGIPLAAPPGTAWSPVVTGDDLCALGEDEFTLVPRTDARRVVPLAVSIPARTPARRVTPGPGVASGDEPGTGPPGSLPGPVPSVSPPGRVPSVSPPGHAPAGSPPGHAPAGSPPGPVPQGWGDGHFPGDRPR